MPRSRTYSPVAREAAQLLGEQIRVGRIERRWTAEHLAERAGISRATVHKIEQGDIGCAVGLVFELAVLVRVPLFDSEQVPLDFQRRQVRDKIALLPKRARERKVEVHDDF